MNDSPPAPPTRTPLGARDPRAALGLLALAVALGCLIYLLVRAFAGSGSVHLARPWLILTALAAVVGTATWLVGERERAAARRAQAEAQDARATAEADAESARETARQAQAQARESREAERVARDAEAEARQSAERTSADAERSNADAETQRDRLRTQIAEERGRREQIVRAWRGEREWNRDLRTQIQRMQRAQGTLGRHDDVRRMVLELTMTMLDAEKGLLITRREDGRPGYSVVRFAGWDNDPRESALAQRFAGEVIERDTTIREDDAAELEEAGTAPADGEIRNLLAIPIYLADDFAGVIVCANRDGGFADLDEEVLIAVGDQAGAVLENSRLHGTLRNAYLATINVLANAIELKDPDLRGHSDHVSEYVLAVADRLHFEPERRERLIFASLLHDVGKLGISERILLKPAALTPEERSAIQLHPRIGYQLVRQVPALQEIAPAVLHHHERFDGEGYPARLRGELIPLESRIIAVADSFSAITSDRPYSPGRSPEEACRELERCAGGQFDPEVVRLFVEEVRRRPPIAAEIEPQPVAPDPEIELARVDGEYRIGARSFGITDSLTLLYSHRHLHETAHAEALRAQLQSRTFGVVLAELAGIGELNRTRGFSAGDEAIQAVADIFQRAAARHRGLAFRASGRRIALIGPDLDQAATDALTVALRTELTQTLNGDHAALGVALGASVWRTGDDGERVIERALGAAHVAALTV